jgi:septum formation protein
LTAVAIGTGDQCEQACSVSDVTFATMTDAEIQDYVNSGEPMGKAGAYAVQGGAAAYISRINGSYTGIMGLPLYETAQLLKRLA